MDVAGCELPDDCLVDLEHDVWWRWEDGGTTARVGVLASLASFAGAFHSFSFRPPAGPVAQGRSVATVESTRYTGAVRMPVDVEVLERNPALLTRPRLLNDRPYTDGWVVRVRPIDPGAPARRLESAVAVRARLEETIRTRRIRCWPLTPDSELIEVGAECAAVLARLKEELARRATGEAILLVTDDATSPIEMVRWSDQTGYPVRSQRREGAIYWFLIEKIAHPVPRKRGS